MAAAIGDNDPGRDLELATAGVDWDARIIGLRSGAFGAQGSDHFGLLQAIGYAASAGADVFNFSAGMIDSWDHLDPQDPQQLRQIQERLEAIASANQELAEVPGQRGVYFVFAADNDRGLDYDEREAESWFDWPSLLDFGHKSIVTGIDRRGNRRPTFGRGGDTIDLAAPGFDVVTFGVRSWQPGPATWATSVGSENGCSYAAPFVTGAASLTLRYRPELKGRPADLRQAILDAVEPRANLAQEVVTGGFLRAAGVAIPDQKLLSHSTKHRVPTAFAEPAYDADFVDVDLDGDLDIVMISGASPEDPDSGSRARIFHGLTAGQPPRVPQGPPQPGVFITHDPDWYFYGDLEVEADYNATAISDVNGDGLPDIALAVFDPLNAERPPNRLLMGELDFLGGYVQRFNDETVQRMPALAEPSRDLRFCDIEGDGDPDMVVGNASGFVSRVYLNDLDGGAGNGTFVDDPGIFDFDGSQDDTHNVICAELDAGAQGGDAGVDFLLFVNHDDGLRLVENDDGAPNRFSDVTAQRLAGPVAPDDAHDAEFCDVDQDGDYDLIVGRREGEPLAYENDGADSWTQQPGWLPPLPVFATREVECADIDGDGAPDIVLGNGDGNIAFQQRDVLLRNQVGPQGVFVDATDDWGMVDDAGEVTSDLELIDIDADGDLDLFKLAFQPHNLHMYVNTCPDSGLCP